MPPPRLKDSPIVLDKEPLSGKDPTKVDGQADPTQQGQSKGPPKEELEQKKKKSEPKKKPTAWIEIKLVDDQNKPVAHEPYQITLPDGTTVHEGLLDDQGQARVSGFAPGTCKVTFPSLDAREWRGK